MDDGKCSSCAGKTGAVEVTPVSNAGSVIIAPRAPALADFRISGHILAGMRASENPVSSLQKNFCSRTPKREPIFQFQQSPSGAATSSPSNELSGPHRLGSSVIDGGPLEGNTLCETGIAQPSESERGLVPQVIAAECKLEDVKKAILDNKDYKEQSISYTDTVTKTDETLTKEEITKRAKTLGDQGAQVDSWGLAYFFINYDVQTKYKFDELDCCCIWVESLTVTLTRQTFIAKDVPKDEREQTEWHEEQHHKGQKEVFEGKKFRDAIAAIPGLKIDKKKPNCKRIKPQEECDKWRLELETEIKTALDTAIADAAKEIADKAEDFHDHEDDLWKKHKAAQKK